MRKPHRSSGRGRRSLPPLNAVAAFEACARLGSTVAAAAELAVTHGAVSKHIALLEAWLDVPLFDRSGVRLVPTAAGAAYAATLGRALDLVDSATRDATSAEGQAATVVRVSTTSSFAALWLLPRLDDFRERHPTIEVWVSESRAAVTIGSDGAGADVALRTGRGPWPGVRAEPLLDDELVPVCAPALRRDLRAPRDLGRARLLHDEDPYAGWPAWLAHAGLGSPSWGQRGSRLADSALLLQAAIAGQGVALARRRLAESPLADGRLVVPFGPPLPLGTAYWLILPARGAPVTRAAKSFAAWVRRFAMS